jgi:hypothetical protein
MPPAEAYAHYNVSSDFSPISGDVLIDVVEGSESDYDHELGRNTGSKNRKKHAAPIQTTFHCWTLTKAVPKSRDDAPNWKRAERVQMTLSSDELGSQVKKQLKAKSLTEMYEALSTDQRQQVEVLLKEKRLDETNRYASWEIAAIHREVRNNMRTRVRETTSESLNRLCQNRKRPRLVRQVTSRISMTCPIYCGDQLSRTMTNTFMLGERSSKHDPRSKEIPARTWLRSCLSLIVRADSLSMCLQW